MLVYFNYATGFRPGNVNNHMEFNARQYDLKLIPARLALGLDATDLYEGKALALARRFFDGDEVANYEIGVKTTFFDGRVRVMAAVYYLDWWDMIVVETEPVLGDQGNSLNFYNTNSGGAEIEGVELELLAFLTDRFSVRVAGDLNETAVKESPLFARGFEDDNELINAPNHSVSIAVDYDIPLRSGWMVSLHADHSIVAEQFTNTANTLSIPKWDKTNARITARRGQWRVALMRRTSLTRRSSAIWKARRPSTGTRLARSASSRLQHALIEPSIDVARGIGSPRRGAPPWRVFRAPA